MNKPTPPILSNVSLGTIQAIAAYGEAMAVWGAAQYKEDAERLQWLHSQVDCHAFGYWLPAICVSNDAREPEPTIDDTRAAIDKARGK